MCGVVAVGTALVSASGAPAHAASTTTTPKTSPASAKNLLTGDDATFSTGVGTWSNFSNASLQWAPASGEGGSGALAVTATGPNMAVASGAFGSGGLTSAGPGQIYSGSIAAESPAGSEGMQPVLSFYTVTGSVITAVFGPETTVGTSEWAPLSPALAIAPPNTAYVQLAIIVYAGTGSTGVLDDAWIEQTGMATTPSVVGPLSTSGNRILQANEEPVTLRGVVMNGLELNPSAPTVTQQAVLQAKAWGANIIRLPLGEQFWLSSNCDYSPGYAATVNQVVNWITSLGMVALLDLHFNTVNGCEAGEPHNMADAAQAPLFWSQVAAQFSSNPLVAFDLYNEPHNIPDALWLNGGPTTDYYAPNETYVAAGMQELYNSVRATGAQNLVFISGNNWANTVPSQLVQGTNIVYAAHVYDCQSLAECQANLPADYDPSPILSRWVSLSSSVPVTVTEFGWPSQEDGTFVANVISYAASHGWGWTVFAWEYTPYPSTFDVTAAGWPATGPVQPAPSGIPVLCAFVSASAGVSPCSAPSFASSPGSTTQNAPSKTSSPSNPPGGSNSSGTGLHSMTVGVLGTDLARGGPEGCASCGSGGVPVGTGGLERNSAGTTRHGASGSTPGVLVMVGLAGLAGALAAVSRRPLRLASSKARALWAPFRRSLRWSKGETQVAGGLGKVGALPG